MIRAIRRSRYAATPRRRSRARSVGNPGVLILRTSGRCLTRGDEYAMVVWQPDPIGMNAPIENEAGCDHAALVSDGGGPFQSAGLDGRALIRVWVAQERQWIEETGTELP